MTALSTEKVTRTKLIDAANNMQAKCKDYTIENPSKDLFMTQEGLMYFHGGVMRMSRWALGQIAETVGIHPGYLQRCLDSEPALAATNVNHWLANRTKPLVVRTYESYIRGFVSTSYVTYDTPEIIETVFDNVSESEWDIKGSFMNPERLHLRMVNKSDMGFVDKLYPALFVDSSDVKKCALSVRFGVYRLVCTNGLIVPKIQMHYRQRHIHVAPDEIADKLYKIVAMVPQMTDDMTNIIKNAEAIPWRVDTDADLERYRKEMKFLSLTAKETNGVLDMLRAKYSPTKWGVVNSMTEFAQSQPLERRLELEKAAGTLLLAA